MGKEEVSSAEKITPPEFPIEENERVGEIPPARSFCGERTLRCRGFPLKAGNEF